jgi:hypothetical protein
MGRYDEPDDQPYGDDESDDPEAPDASDWTDEDEDADQVACLACGRAIWEEAQQCPHCGEWVGPGARGPTPWALFVAIALLVLLAALFVLTRVSGR